MGDFVLSHALVLIYLDLERVWRVFLLFIQHPNSLKLVALQQDTTNRK